MKTVSIVIALCSAFTSASASPAEWPMHRHDKLMTARSEGVGDIASPTISWQYDLRAWAVTVAITHDPDAKSDIPCGPFDKPKALSQTEKKSWGLIPKLIDLAGDGKLVPAPRYAAKILKVVPGYQHFATDMQDNVSGSCVLYAYDKGKRREVWRSEQFNVYQGPHPIVADANGDGQLDVIACPHYQIAVMDGRSGKIIQKLRWHNGRNYGHFIAKNIDDDPALEFLVIADFYSHIDLIDNDGKDLKLLWRKEIELKIENKQKILRPRWDSFQDLDDDGKFEVITNLYNDTGDKKWHLMVYDALTGDTLFDLPEVYMEGLEDLDGDGKVEIFCTTAKALYAPTSSRLRALNLSEGKVIDKWQYPRGAWALGQRRYPLYINSNVAHGNENIFVTDLGAEGKGFYITEPPADGDGGPSLLAFTMNRDGKVHATWALTAPRDAKSFKVLASRAAADEPTEALISFGTAAVGGSGLHVAHGTARVVSWERSGVRLPHSGALVAADLDGDGRLTVASVTANDDVIGISPPIAGGKPRLRWRRHGAGSLCAADFSADGKKELAMLGWDRSGQGSATVVDGSGKTIWTSICHGFPGPMEPWNFGTLTVLAAGKFSGGKHEDLIVFSRRSTMHSDEGHAFRGTDGESLWSRVSSFDGQREWGFGGTPVVTYDTNGDGCEDIISLYPVNLTIVSGRDGEQLVGRSAAGESIFPGIWAAYASPMLFDFDRDNKMELVWNGGYCIGLTNLKGDTKWAKTPAAVGLPADANADGAWDIASTAGSAVRWLDPSSGDPRWSLDLPANVGDSAVADIDGDGLEELLAACGDKLVATRVKDNKPAILWQFSAPSKINSFILADTDADGKLEAILLCDDSHLYGVDQE